MLSSAECTHGSIHSACAAGRRCFERRARIHQSRRLGRRDPSVPYAVALYSPCNLHSLHVPLVQLCLHIVCLAHCLSYVLRVAFCVLRSACCVLCDAGLKCATSGRIEARRRLAGVRRDAIASGSGFRSRGFMPNTLAATCRSFPWRGTERMLVSTSGSEPITAAC